MSGTAEPKWRRRADDRPDEVLDAALRLFVRNGFAATKVEDIAADARPLERRDLPLLFRQGGDLRATGPAGADAIAEHSTRLAQTSKQPPEVLLKTIMMLVMGRMADPQTMALPRLVLMEAGRFPALAQAYRRQVIDRAMEALQTIIQRGVEDGRFRPVDPRLAIRNILGPMLAHALLLQVFGIGEDDDITPQSFVDSHLDILLNGLSAHKEGG